MPEPARPTPASLLNVKAAAVPGRSKRETPSQQSMTQSLKLPLHTDVLMTFEIKQTTKKIEKPGSKRSLFQVQCLACKFLLIWYHNVGQC